MEICSLRVHLRRMASLKCSIHLPEDRRGLEKQLAVGYYCMQMLRLGMPDAIAHSNDGKLFLISDCGWHRATLCDKETVLGKSLHEDGE